MKKYFLLLFLLSSSVQIVYSDEILGDDELPFLDFELLEEDLDTYDDIFLDKDLDNAALEEEIIISEVEVDNTQPNIENNSSSDNWGNSWLSNKLSNNIWKIWEYKTISVVWRQAIRKKIAALYYGKNDIEKRKMKLKLTLKIQNLEKKYIDNDYALKVLRYLRNKLLRN